MLDIAELRKDDIALVGGKGANLGEMMENGFPVPPGFVVTTVAFSHFLKENSMIERLDRLVGGLRADSDSQLTAASEAIRCLFDEFKIPQDLADEITDKYRQMATKDGKLAIVAVRSSATAEDLPTASFAGQQDTYLNISGESNVLEKVRRCWSSLFTPRAISYRISKGFDHSQVKLAVVIQRMIDSDVSGVMFTLDPTSSTPHMMIEAGYGQGEAIVSGKVTPDTYFVETKTHRIVDRTISTQKWKLIMGSGNDLQRTDIPYEESKKQKLSDNEIIELAKIGSRIESHYGGPMDIEWCMEDYEFFMVQARPVTTLGENDTKKNRIKSKEHENGKAQKVILKGLAASPGVASGPVKLYWEEDSLDVVKKGDILVTKMTSPDMVPAMTRAAAIVTDEGGMTCHAAIVARELGTPCIVGSRDATKLLKDGLVITIDGTRGIVLEGAEEEKEEAQAPGIVAVSVPVTGTKIMANVGIPHKAEEYSKLAVSGVGLMRIEFLFTSFIGEHPQAMLEKGRKDELVSKLAEGIGIVGKAFFPRPVILRLSDFKTNEYRDMKGGEKFEPSEQNPMIGWRGCSRYVSPQYMEAFKCELLAIKKVREEMNLKNIWVMLPFVRTIAEVKEIDQMMQDVGLVRGNDFKLYLMAEVPVIIFMAEEFAEVCDGFFIGSNDLTQLIMGADRDSEILGKMGYFDERYEAIKRAIKMLIEGAHKKGVPVGICGQAPSVYPEFTEFLVRAGIDSISLNPDIVVKTIGMIASIEQRIIMEGLQTHLCTIRNNHQTARTRNPD